MYGSSVYCCDGREALLNFQNNPSPLPPPWAGKMTFISKFVADLCAVAVKTDAISLTAVGGFSCAYLPGIRWSEKRRDFANYKRFGE